MKLRIYDHCPYCLKTRVIFGLRNIPVELYVLLNNDTEIPTRMVGQKQTPILQESGSRYMLENMDIVHYVGKLGGKPLLIGKHSPVIEEWPRKVNGYVDRLSLPRSTRSAFDEFSTPAAHKHFVDKEETSAGNPADLLAHSGSLTKNIGGDLCVPDKLVVKLNAVGGELSKDDTRLFLLLRNLMLVTGISWSNRIADYCDSMTKQTQINLLLSMTI